MSSSAVRIIALLALPGLAGAASFTPLGDLPGGEFRSAASDVSSDGTVVVGFSPSASGFEGFRWTAGAGMVGLGDFPGIVSFTSSASGVSADGTVVTGSGTNRAEGQAFRWTSSGGMVGLGYLTAVPSSSSGNAISADGNVIVGSSESDIGNNEAFRWTSGGGMVGLGDLPGGSFNSFASAVSADGAVVVGGSAVPEESEELGGLEAFRWTSAGGMVGLGDLPGADFYSMALDVSADGSVVAGFSNSASGEEAFRWTVDGMVGLGDLPGGAFGSFATGVSGDGAVAIGVGSTDSGREAFVWTSGGGMQRLMDVLVANGAGGLEGWTLTWANAISADGRWIVGQGINPDGFDEAYLANISPVPAPPAVWLLATAVAGLGWRRVMMGSATP